MPRLIDHAARDSEITAASFRVLERDGLAGLSVRGVAEEAGIAPASLRRAFPTQRALRERCLNEIEQRATERVRAVAAPGRAAVERLLAQLLPLDEERRLELIAQVQLSVLAITEAEMREPAARLSAGVARACHIAIELLRVAGDLGENRDVESEAERLRALLDGLAMRGVWAGDGADPESTMRLLRAHLDDIATQRPAQRSSA